ncbi:MAG TPA: hypothetical protein VME17_16370 [Bryobacteraceae bacterium]|nr:hypothetical protein [Bryobacteraceae bacterium]
MKFALSILGLAAGLSLASVASATVTTYTFATSNTTVANGSTYCATYSTSCSGKQTVTVYGETTGNGGNVSGLFTVTDTPNNFGAGIAPYDPSEGGSPFSSQRGISETTGDYLLLDVSNITAGSTLSLLLDAGTGGDQVAIYTSTGSMPTSLGSMTEVLSNVNVGSATNSNGSVQPTTPQITGLSLGATATSGWIAIQADCDYLLLNTLTITSPSGVPEPRFYGLLLAGFLALCGIAYKRRSAQSNA